MAWKRNPTRTWINTPFCVCASLLSPTRDVKGILDGVQKTLFRCLKELVALLRRTSSPYRRNPSRLVCSCSRPVAPTLATIDSEQLLPTVDPRHLHLLTRPKIPTYRQLPRWNYITNSRDNATAPLQPAPVCFCLPLLVPAGFCELLLASACLCWPLLTTPNTSDNV